MIPSNAFNFTTATNVDIHLNQNMITTIQPGAFNFSSASVISVFLSYNKISALPPNLFAQGNENIFYCDKLHDNAVNL